MSSASFRRLSALALLVMVVPDPAALAAPQKAPRKTTWKKRTTNPFIPAAERLLEALEYEEALVTLEKAASWPNNTRRELVQIAILEGVLRAELGEEELALTAFRRGIALDLKTSLPVDVSPKIQELFREAQGQLKPEQTEAQPRPLDAPPQAAGTAPTAAAPAPSPAPPASAPAVPGSSATTEGASAPPSTSAVAVRPPGPLSASDDEDEDAAREEASPQVVVKVQGQGQSGLRSVAWLPATAGGVLLAGGVASWFQAKSVEQRLRASDSTITTSEQLKATVQEGRRYESGAWLLGGVGVLGLASAAGLYLLGAPESRPDVIVVPTAQGLSAAAGWRF